MITSAQKTFFSRERLAELRHAADLINVLVRRELKVKYRGSFLGYLWSMLNPLLFMTTISIVFSFIVKNVPYYPLYVLSGILFWNLTTTSLSVGTGSIIAGAALIRKVRMPVWVLPVVPVLTFSMNFLFALFPYVILYAILGPDHLPSFWALPVVMLLFMVFLSGLTMSLSTLNVFFRDVGHVIEPLLVMLMYATPIIYDRQNPIFPAKVSSVLGLNPFTHFVEVGRKALFSDVPVTLTDFARLGLLATVSLTVGIVLYRRNVSKFVFVL